MTPEIPQPFTWKGTAEGVYDFASGVVSLTEIGQGTFLEINPPNPPLGKGGFPLD